MEFTPVVKELIFDTNKPFASCHASHLTLLPNGDILAAWFAGSEEGADDISIWGSRREGGIWTKPVQLADEVNEPHWNPVFHRKADGELVLFYKVGRLLKEWYTMVKTSRDEGRSWSAPVELVAGDRGGRGPVRNKLIVLKDGTWLAPASTEDGIWQSFADRSEDEGKSWTKSGDIRIEELDYGNIQEVTDSDIPVSKQSFIGRGVIQPTLWESEPGKVHMLLRSTEGFIYRSDSDDGGRSWCGAYPTSLPNNNSGIDVVKLDNGTLVLAFNPVGDNWGPRSPLVLRASEDNGLTWGSEFVLENEAGEYSYPAIIAEGNNLYMTYTWKRESIAFRQISVG
ncbi:exo-alpha-sialidase [Paenibacillus validus]|uniref:Neuraminidase (Sialidase) n=1 Tax=Paenibacillus validus TaxID=44253 RepID=A0A7X2Z9F1_9BACL|nr:MULTISPECIES: sialidase family protein [Paenibacillus]MED4599371.1 exo-alpha-sialidase [Paenibacillus validus]MED4606317.1 exo-alpha-sialidase [Paenibacillus validus]MUG70160.1 neuraminidase (sialidase) [Paenibacillus validus]